ncbi:Box C/D snoRNA accumulation [Malassezia sp. CBS 17886]|nr:Box C/D snoRNA accumulation [Malassezia sp. CBS 17886]
MPASCVVCAAAQSKYKCPYCTEATCSLACFREHKKHAPCASRRTLFEEGRVGASIGAVPGSSLLALHEKSVDRFVPMCKYDERQMMQDFKYLSQVGHVVTATGRHLSESNMLRAEETGATRKKGPKRLSTAESRREQLAKQLAYRRLPVMLLPYGMSRRSQNRTAWDPRKRTMHYTLQFLFPTDAPIARGVLDALGLDDSASGSIGDLRGGAGAESKSMHHAGAAAGTNGGSSPSAPTSTALACPTVNADSVLLLRLYPLRLRNESTTRFLDWWARKGAAMEQMAARIPTRAAPQRPLVSQAALDSMARWRGEGDARSAERAEATVAAYAVVPDARCTLESILARLPPDYGVVEFPELELWRRRALDVAVWQQRAAIVPLQEGVTGDAMDDGGGHGSGGGGRPGDGGASGARGTRGAAFPPAPSAAATAPPPVASPVVSPRQNPHGSGADQLTRRTLVTYASTDEEC